MNAKCNYCSNSKGRDIETALIAAASKGHTGVVSYLLSAGADVNAKDKNHKTALIAAELNFHDETVKHLLDSGADVNVVYNHHGVNYTALILALGNIRIQIAKYMLVNGKDVNVNIKGGKDNVETALSIALNGYKINNGYSEIINLIKSAGTKDVNCK